MVTGAGGSIGSEICRQIAELNPKILLLVDQNEYALYQIHQELEAKFENRVVVPLLASVQDKPRIFDIMSTWSPHTVFHAAAYKHVPLVEHNLMEGVKNNVIGTLVTAQASIENKVENFVLVSTDKAVRPANIMGASKRLAEMILQALDAEDVTVNFAIVRFGNVLDSSGSVVPKFRKQIKDGGPITITHKDVTRFFMTIPEASQLVVQAGAMADGGEVFLLDMGEPVKIIDLASQIIDLSGLTIKSKMRPEGDIEIKFVGLRPGEKLYEELLVSEGAEKTSHPRILKAREEFLEWGILKNKLSQLSEALEQNNIASVPNLLKDLVSDYRPTGEIVDWVHKNKQSDK